MIADGMASPGYTHTPLINTNLSTTNWSKLSAYSTNVPFAGDTNAVSVQWSLPIDQSAGFYRVLSEKGGFA